MQALLLESFGSPLRLAEVSRPAPGPGQVLVKVGASGVNPLDLKIMAGAAGHAQAVLPAILGLDLAGTVEETGAGVTQFQPGDQVYGLTGGVGGLPGSLAEFAAVDADLLALKPRNLTMREAAAIPLGFITAWEGLVDHAKVHTGQQVLIHAGAGGVGQMAVQIARALGAEVFATVSPQKQTVVEGYGATPIDYRSSSVEQYVREHTGGQGFDVVYDTVGGKTLDNSFLAVKPYTGHVVSCLGWGTHSLAPLSFRSATYSGVFTLTPMLTGRGRPHHGEILREATRLAEAGKLKPLLEPSEFTLATAHQAHELAGSGQAGGKVVITI
ncbi:zinc-dependent alcohol dehydrogenase family protein [uncultured Paludibaculum sp.]|uniref:zinc-dependent alcohol dehydrogenase family protein n=1 Tax=uncultured Paludibaculum sp. TaxID=1765020 RepID=UPI002AAB0949|nr:zinc-dependent alcohol dehydrogenase family protein [uncultured Paludibaculum sp.]